MLIPHHSNEFRKLKARLKLLRVVRLGIYARRKTGQQLLPHGRCAEPGGHEGGIPTDRPYRLAERYGLIGHSTQRQVQCSLCTGHSSQPLSKRRSCMSCISTLPMHLTLWTTQRQLNALDVDLLHCSRCHGVVSRPTWPTCPGKLSSLRLGLVFNCLLLVLRATGIAHRLMTGLRTPARGFADDDLVLCTESPEDMKRSEASGYTNSRQSSCTTLSVN